MIIASSKVHVHVSGPKPKVSEACFDDLMGVYSFKPSKGEPKTIKEMRKLAEAETTDPEKLRVSMVWAKKQFYDYNIEVDLSQIPFSYPCTA